MPITRQTYFQPTQISGCIQWLDATDNTTIYSSYPGTLAGNGSTVTQWNDKSGAGNHVYQNASSTCPTFTLASNALNFSGGGGLWNSVGYALSSNVSFFTVMISPGTGWGTWGTLWGHFRSGGHDADIQFRQESLTNGYVSWHTNNNNNNYLAIPTVGTKTLYSCTMSNGVNMFLQNSYSGSTASATYTEGAMTIAGGTVAPFWIGRSDSGEVYNGYICEIIYYNQKVSDTQRRQVEAYLAQKWSLTTSLPTGHPGLTSLLYRNLQPILTKTQYYTAFSPKQIGGCSLWLDAADASSVTLNTTTAFTETFANAGVPTSAYSGNGVANGTTYAYLVGNTAFSPYLTQANWTWTNYGGISYGTSPFAGVNPITTIPGSLGYSAFIQVNNSTPSTLVRTTTIPIGVLCTVSFWYSSRDNAAMPLSIGVKYGTITIATITQPISASVWKNSTTTFISSVANQNLIFTVTQDGTNSYYGGDQTANIAYVQLTYSTVTNVADKSGNGVVLSNATGFTYPNRSFNGLFPSFLCSSGGVGQANAAATLGYNSSFAQTTPFTVFFVSHQTQTAGAGYIMDSQSGSGRQYTYNETLSSPFGNAGTNITSSPSVVCQTWIAGTSVLYLNGTSKYSGTLGSFTTGGIIVGNRFSLNESWPGHICELIYYSGQLGTTQQQQVESYLAQKWGLVSSLPTTGHLNAIFPAGSPTAIQPYVTSVKLALTNIIRLAVFSYTGSIQTYTVPAGKTSATIYIWGAAGGGDPYGNSGGAGAFITGIMPVTPGATYYIVVGGGGRGLYDYPALYVNPGGYGGGGTGYYAAGGGGYSGIFSGLTPAQGNTLLLAGGGGGAGPGGYGGSAAWSGTAQAGGGGGVAGSAGQGATTSAGGAAGTPQTQGVNGTTYPGTALAGGNGCQNYGGAGGGGYWGGGGGTYNNGANGGGGGSSYSNSTYLSSVSGAQSTTGSGSTVAPGNTNPYYVSGAGAAGVSGASGGNGLVVIN